MEFSNPSVKDQKRYSRNLLKADIIAIHKTLEDCLDTKIVVAGGCVRDLMADSDSLYTKDIDCFPVGDYNEEEIISKLVNELGGLYIKRYLSTDAYDVLPSEHFAGVVKLWLHGRNVDIIFRKDNPKTGEDVISKFDSNLNTFYYTLEDGFVEGEKSFTRLGKVVVNEDSSVSVDYGRVSKQMSNFPHFKAEFEKGPMI